MNENKTTNNEPTTALTPSDDCLAKVREELLVFKREERKWLSDPKASEIGEYNSHLFSKENLATEDFRKPEGRMWRMGYIGYIGGGDFQQSLSIKNFLLPAESSKQTGYGTTFTKLVFGKGSVEDRIRWFMTSEDAITLPGLRDHPTVIYKVMADLHAHEYIPWDRRNQEAAHYLGLDPDTSASLDIAADFEQANVLIRHIFPVYEEIVGNAAELPLGTGIDHFLTWIYDKRIKRKQHVWTYSPNTNMSYMDSESGDIYVKNNVLGDLADYTTAKDICSALKLSENSIEQTNNARTYYSFAHTMQEGDLIFALKGRDVITAWGFVSGPYLFKEEDEYQHRRTVNWKDTGHWTRGSTNSKTLTDITEHTLQIQNLIDSLRIKQNGFQLPVCPISTVTTLAPSPIRPYDLDAACQGVFIPRDTIAGIVDRLTLKLNVILQGPPGVGKTYVARRLAWLLMEEQDDARIELVQFHQSMGYEDFVHGYRPEAGGHGFKRKDGAFINFCHRARKDPGRKWVFIIDEINRGNMSKIFGELLMLIEHDKRTARYAARLALHEDGEEPFYVPPNVHIIGLMNTADRSLAVVDHALRRRFSYIDIAPAFGQVALHDWLTRFWEDDIAETIDLRMSELNRAIANDPDLGAGFMIGHSHFCDQQPDIKQTWDDYRVIIESDIAPLLREYWFDRASDANNQIESLLHGIDA